MNHLLERMHTGVGAPGTHSGDRTIREAGQGVLQMVLHRLPAGLGLPSMEPPSLVGHAQGQTLGAWSSRPAAGLAEPHSMLSSNWLALSFKGPVA